jgi:predicted TIM-barrel fold metal-dependent hydrolase
LLDKHPNLYTDLSYGGGIAIYIHYLDKDPAAIRDFVLKYQDRILFGSDLILGIAANNLDWLYHWVKCDVDVCQKGQFTCESRLSDVVHQGLGLDDQILRKLYYDNPKRVLGL